MQFCIKCRSRCPNFILYLHLYQVNTKYRVKPFLSASAANVFVALLLAPLAAYPLWILYYVTLQTTLNALIKFNQTCKWIHAFNVASVNLKALPSHECSPAMFNNCSTAATIWIHGIQFGLNSLWIFGLHVDGDHWIYHPNGDIIRFRTTTTCIENL